MVEFDFTDIGERGGATQGGKKPEPETVRICYLPNTHV